MSAAFSASEKAIACRAASGLPNVTRSRACSMASSCALRASPTQVIPTAMRLGVRKPPKATSRPRPSSPRRFSTGTGVPSKTRCAWSVPRTPSDSPMSTACTFGLSRSTMSATVPSLPVVPSMRAKSSQRSHVRPKVMRCFSPLRR